MQPIYLRNFAQKSGNQIHNDLANRTRKKFQYLEHRRSHFDSLGYLTQRRLDKCYSSSLLPSLDALCASMYKNVLKLVSE